MELLILSFVAGLIVGLILGWRLRSWWWIFRHREMEAWLAQMRRQRGG